MGEMLESLSHAEYIDWLAYYSLNKFPDEREDLRTGILVSAIIDSLQGKNGNSYKKQILEMLDVWGDEKRKTQTPEEVVGKLKTLFAFFDAKG